MECSDTISDDCLCDDFNTISLDLKEKDLVTPRWWLEKFYTQLYHTSCKQSLEKNRKFYKDCKDYNYEFKKDDIDSCNCFLKSALVFQNDDDDESDSVSDSDKVSDIDKDIDVHTLNRMKNKLGSFLDYIYQEKKNRFSFTAREAHYHYHVYFFKKPYCNKMRPNLNLKSMSE
jgi:hypothetical protein